MAEENEEEWKDEEIAKPFEVSIEICLGEVVDNPDAEYNGPVVVRVLPGSDADVNELARTSSGRASRAPADVCCVVDISGSMCSTVKVEVAGEERNDGLNRLDIAKHAVKSVMHVLKPDDRFALIAFDDVAETVVPLQFMTSEGRERAIASLDELRHRARTNIWAGIYAAMEALRCPTGDDGIPRQKTILLLTDGEPTVLPEKGHLPELREYKEAHPSFNFQMNTFGFCYELDSQLLLDLAVEGKGTFSFIPDAAIVGTCFVNSIANSLSTMAQSTTLHITPKGGAEFTGGPVGVYSSSVTEASWGRVVSLGPLQFGQPRDVVVPMHIPSGAGAYLEATIVIQSADGQDVSASTTGTAKRTTPAAIGAVARAATVSVMQQALERVEGGSTNASVEREKVLSLGMQFEGFENSSDHDAFVAALKSDVQGRIAKAMDGKDRFDRWGKHYLRALLRAHQLQVCTNFMDAGLQEYGGELFKALRDEGDQSFVSLPPPRPSNRRPAPQRPSCRPVASAPVASAPAPADSDGPDMQHYYAGGGGG